MIQTEAELVAHVSHPFDAESERALAMRLTSDEFIIATFPKCGTTWAGQIAHGLRSRGDMSFNSLGEVVPWLESGHLFGHDLSRPLKHQPHVFKSHMAPSDLPRGAKIINIIRDPADTLVSYYNFWSDVLIDPDSITPEMMANLLFLSDRSDGPRNMFRLNYFQHLVDFHTADYDGQVLFIAYEDMKLNLPAAVRRIARFMDIELDRMHERIVTTQASFDFMHRHRDQFREVLPGGSMDMVVTGKTGEGKSKLTSALRRTLDDAWRQQVMPVLGYRSYEQLRREISLT